LTFVASSSILGSSTSSPCIVKSLLNCSTGIRRQQEFRIVRKEHRQFRIVAHTLKACAASQLRAGSGRTVKELRWLSTVVDIGRMTPDMIRWSHSSWLHMRAFPTPCFP
jgi:hypothetical protein